MSLKLKVIGTDSFKLLERDVNKFLKQFNMRDNPKPEVSFTVSPNQPSTYIYAYILYAEQHLKGAKKL